MSEIVPANYGIHTAMRPGSYWSGARSPRPYLLQLLEDALEDYLTARVVALVVQQDAGEEARRTDHEAADGS